MINVKTKFIDQFTYQQADIFLGYKCSFYIRIINNNNKIFIYTMQTQVQ